MKREERGYIKSFTTNYKKLTEKEMGKALHMYIFCNPLTFCLLMIIIMLLLKIRG